MQADCLIQRSVSVAAVDLEGAVVCADGLRETPEANQANPHLYPRVRVRTRDLCQALVARQRIRVVALRTKTRALVEPCLCISSIDGQRAVKATDRFQCPS